MSDGTRIPVVLCVDVEPDGPGDTPTPGRTWAGTTAMHAWLQGWRARFEDRTGRPVRLSWFLRMDPQVTALFGSPTHVVEAHAAMLDEVQSQDDGVGLHIHAWRQTELGWLDDVADTVWFGECIDASFVAFAKALARPCRLSRLGTRYLDEALARRLVDHGVAVDLTVEPGQVDRPDGSVPRLRGTLPDYRRSPRRPHEVVPGLQELPLTAGRKSLGFQPRAHLSRMRRHGIAQRLDQPLPFGQPAHGPHPFGEQVRRSLSTQRRPYLAFAIRSDGLLDPVRADRLDRHMAALLDLPEATRFELTTPEEALVALR